MGCGWNLCLVRKGRFAPNMFAADDGYDVLCKNVVGRRGPKGTITIITESKAAKRTFMKHSPPRPLHWPSSRL